MDLGELAYKPEAPLWSSHHEVLPESPWKGTTASSFRDHWRSRESPLIGFQCRKSFVFFNGKDNDDWPAVLRHSDWRCPS